MKNSGLPMRASQRRKSMSADPIQGKEAPTKLLLNFCMDEKLEMKLLRSYSGYSGHKRKKRDRNQEKRVLF